MRVAKRVPLQVLIAREVFRLFRAIHVPRRFARGGELFDRGTARPTIARAARGVQTIAPVRVDSIVEHTVAPVRVAGR